MGQNGPHRTPDLCGFCQNGVDRLTIRHILINCKGLKYSRRRFYHANSMRYLFENIPLKRILAFTRFIEIFPHI